MAAKDYLGHDPSSPDSTVESSFDKERDRNGLKEADV